MPAHLSEGGTYYIEGASPGDEGSFQQAFEDAIYKLRDDPEYEDVRNAALRNKDGLVRLHVESMYVRWTNPVHDYRIVLGIDT